MDSFKTLKNRIYQLHSFAAKIMNQTLMQNPLGKDALHYLHQRGMNNKTIKDYQIGYTYGHYLLTNAAFKHHFNGYEMMQSGLFSTRGKYLKMCDKFEFRVMFPITDNHNHIIAFSGRNVLPKDDMIDDKIPKYLNSPNTVVFKKEYNFFGLKQALPAIKKKKSVILVEGNIDVTSFHQVGIYNTIASLGTSLTMGQINKLNKMCNRILICYDGDTPGQDAINRAITMFKPFKIKTYAISLPTGVDPDEYVQSCGRQSTINYISNNYVTALVFKLRYLENELSKYIFKDTRELLFLHKAMLIVIQYTTNKDRNQWLSYIALKIGISKQDVIKEGKRMALKYYNGYTQ